MTSEMTKAERNPNDESRKRGRGGRLFVLLCGLSLTGWSGGTANAFGQLPLPKPATAAASNNSRQAASQSESPTPAAEIQSIESKLAEVRAKIAATEELGDTAITNAPPGVAPQDITVRRALLHRLSRLLEQ